MLFFKGKHKAGVCGVHDQDDWNYNMPKRNGKTIAVRLKELRIKNNLSQQDLANKLGIKRQSVSNWEIGRTYPSLDNLVKLSKIYKRDVLKYIRG